MAENELMVVPKGELAKIVQVVDAEMEDGNLAKYLDKNGVNSKLLIGLLMEFVEFTARNENEREPLEVLQGFYDCEAIEDFIERLKHDTRKVGKATNAASVGEGTKAV